MRVIFGILTVLATYLCHAATPINGWYSTLFGGYSYLPNNVNNGSTGVILSHATYQPGFDGGGSIGFKSNPMRYEGELTYLRADINKFNINYQSAIDPRGYSDAVFAMANVYYDFPNLLQLLQPYLGGGIGYGWVEAHLRGTSPLGFTNFKGSNCEFSYQGMAGVTYNFSENYALYLGYRYTATLKANELGKFYQANLANIGAVYRFDEARYK